MQRHRHVRPLALAAALAATTVLVAMVPAAAQTDVAGTEVFAYTGSPQSFVVPDGVTEILVETYGASGGDLVPAESGCSDAGGEGGFAVAVLDVAPGETIAVMVGGQGAFEPLEGINTGGFNGGGDGGGGNVGSGGGGASDVRIGGNGLEDRALVAGGGGGIRAGCNGGGNGGDGGGTSGGDATEGLATGATQSTGGDGDGDGTDGSLGLGGVGGSGGSLSGGGGGGGLYGGGGGGAGVVGVGGGGPGGGGSGYCPGDCLAFGAGGNVGDGLVVITYGGTVPPTPPAPSGPSAAAPITAAPRFTG